MQLFVSFVIFCYQNWILWFGFGLATVAIAVWSEIAQEAANQFSFLRIMRLFAAKIAAFLYSCLRTANR